MDDSQRKAHDDWVNNTIAKELTHKVIYSLLGKNIPQFRRGLLVGEWAMVKPT